MGAEPRTEAGRALLAAAGPDWNPLRAILAIEAEAAEPPPADIDPYSVAHQPVCSGCRLPWPCYNAPAEPRPAGDAALREALRSLVRYTAGMEHGPCIDADAMEVVLATPPKWR